MTFLDANAEILRTLMRPYVWVLLAWEELKDRYRRSIIGLLWIPLSFLLFVGVKILVFTQLNQASLEMFTVHVVLGYWIWQTLSAFMIDSGHTFVRASGYIKSSPLSYSTYVMQSVFRNSVPFFYNAIIALGICWIATSSISVHYLWVIPAYVVFAVNAIWVSLLVGVIGARHRDIVHFIQTIMRVLFFLTPIIWVPAQLGRIGELISLYNPLAHYINIIREPIATGTIPTLSWMVLGAITATGWLIATFVYSRARRNIVHWV